MRPGELSAFLATCCEPALAVVAAFDLRAAFLAWSPSGARPTAREFLLALRDAGADLELISGTWWCHGFRFTEPGWTAWSDAQATGGAA